MPAVAANCKLQDLAKLREQIEKGDAASSDLSSLSLAAPVTVESFLVAKISMGVADASAQIGHLFQLVA